MRVMAQYIGKNREESPYCFGGGDKISLQEGEEYRVIDVNFNSSTPLVCLDPPGELGVWLPAELFEYVLELSPSGEKTIRQPINLEDDLEIFESRLIIAP